MGWWRTRFANSGVGSQTWNWWCIICFPFTRVTLSCPTDWMRALFEAIDDAVFVHDSAGRILEANPAACRRLGLSEDITNVSGSGCSLGHPVAATGARMIITTMYELRRRGGGLGLASMCAGGGMGSATVFEVYPG